MEDVTYNGNHNVEFYDIQILSDSEKEKIENGEYPIILAQSGVFTKKYVTAGELCKYTHWDALDSDKEEQASLHGEGIPIVWECTEDGTDMIETGLPHKVIEESAE